MDVHPSKWWIILNMHDVTINNNTKGKVLMSSPPTIQLCTCVRNTTSCPTHSHWQWLTQSPAKNKDEIFSPEPMYWIIQPHAHTHAPRMVSTTYFAAYYTLISNINGLTSPTAIMRYLLVAAIKKARWHVHTACWISPQWSVFNKTKLANVTHTGNMSMYSPFEWLTINVYL